MRKKVHKHKQLFTDKRTTVEVCFFFFQLRRFYSLVGWQFLIWNECSPQFEVSECRLCSEWAERRISFLICVLGGQWILWLHLLSQNKPKKLSEYNFKNIVGFQRPQNQDNGPVNSTNVSSCVGTQHSPIGFWVIPQCVIHPLSSNSGDWLGFTKENKKFWIQD